MCHVSYPGFFPIGHIGGPSSPFDGLAGNPRHRQRRWPRREFRTHVETTPVTPVFRPARRHRPARRPGAGHADSPSPPEPATGAAKRKRRAHACLGPGPRAPLLTSVRFWLTNCTARGCTHVSGLPTRHPATAWIAARTPPRTPPRTPAQAPGSNAGSPARAGGLAPYASPDGAARGTVTVQGDATLANDTLWQGGVRAVGLALSAGLFWALFAISLARRIETSASRDISQRVRAWRRAPMPRHPAPVAWKASTRPWSTPAAGSTPRSRSRTRGSSRCKARSTATPSPGCRTASISWTVSARR